LLEDILEPEEVIITRLPFSEKINGEKYDELAVTNKRLLWYKRKGLLFKKDSCNSISYNQLSNVKFLEKGVLRKKGVLELYLKDGSSLPQLEGKPSEIKYLYQNIVSKL